MSNLIFDNIRYNNTLFCDNPLKIEKNNSFFSLRDFKIMEVATTTQRVKRQFAHGEMIGDTYNNAREMVLVFDAFAPDEIARFQLIKQIGALFAADNIRKRLEFDWPDGSQRWIEAKTIERPSYSDYDNNRRITASVKLISRNNSNIYSLNKTTIAVRNGGFGVIVPLWTPFIYWYDGTVIDYHGVSEAEVYIRITATKDNATPYGYLKIQNKNDLTKTLVTIALPSFNTGDVLTLDSTTWQVTLQHPDSDTVYNITASVDPSSIYPLLQRGNNSLWIYNGGEEEMMTGTLEYYDTMN